MVPRAARRAPRTRRVAYHDPVLVCLSASHRSADFDLLGTLAEEVEGLSSVLADRRGVSGSIVLATCNRVEVYLDVEPKAARQPAPGTSADATTASWAVDQVTGGITGLPPKLLRSAFVPFVGTAAVEHLFRVAAGLESVVVGEDEISGQVRRALETARERGTTSRELEQAFQRASTASRRARRLADIDATGRSVVHLALDIAETRVASWAELRVLLVGSGRYARTVVTGLRQRGVRDIAVYSRSGRGAAFAASRGARLVEADDYPRAAADADMIVCCSTGAEPVLDAATLLAGRREPVHPLPVAPLPAVCAAGSDCPVPAGAAADGPFIIDLALPRNVAADVVELQGVGLLDLQTVALHARLDRFRVAETAVQAIEAAVDSYAERTRQRAVEPAMVALRRHVLGIVDAEIDRARARGETDERTEHALRHLGSVLLHGAMERGREAARRGEPERYLEAVETLFGLRMEPEAPGAAGDAAAIGETG